MTFDEYQNIASRTDQVHSGAEQKKFLIPLMGLIGAVGSLIAEYKKYLRDGSAHENFSQNIAEELGDALWYVATLARRYDLSLSKVSHGALVIRSPSPVPLLAAVEQEKIVPDNLDDLNIFQSECSSLQRLDIEEERNLFVALIETSKKSNDLIEQAMRTNNFHDQQTIMKVGLGTILWQISYIASIRKMKLGEIASQNINKIVSRWPPTKSSGHTLLFDDDYPEHERFPRKMKIVFRGYTKNDGSEFTIMTCNGIQIGDRLTDNTHDDSGYRFHDAIHYAFVAVLGWSPVMRGLLKLKRKSNSKTDEVDDGARASIIEEAIVGLTYDYARDHNMLEGQTEIDHSRIKIIQKLCRGLEVEQCKPWEWRKAILAGYEMFRHLRENKGGCLVLDLTNRNIGYLPL